MDNFWNRGHDDYTAGRPFPKEYETWQGYEQRSYEHGRIAAVERKLPIKERSWQNRPPRQQQGQGSPR